MSTNPKWITPTGSLSLNIAIGNVLESRHNGDIIKAWNDLKDLAMVTANAEIIKYAETFIQQTEEYINTERKKRAYTNASTWAKDNQLLIYLDKRNDEFLKEIMIRLSKAGITQKASRDIPTNVKATSPLYAER